MTTLKDWDNETALMTDTDLTECREALARLRKWDFFTKSFNGIGLTVVESIIGNEQRGRAYRGEFKPARPKTKIRQSTTGKLHLSLGMSAAHCSSGNRGMNFHARVSAKNAKTFPIDMFCRHCFGDNPLDSIDLMVSNGELD